MCLSLPSSDRLVADCSHLNLTDSPTFSVNVTDIDLSFNQLQVILIKHPSPSRVLNLNFAYNNISTISTENNQHPFHGCTQLRSLNLSSNGIQLTEAIFHDDVFTGLQKLEVLDIFNNTKLDQPIHNGTQTLDKVWHPLESLRSLVLDGIQNVTFGVGISTLRNLSHLRLAGRRSTSGLRVIDEDCFQNFRHIEKLDLSSQNSYNLGLKFYDRSNCSLEAIHRSAIAKLKGLKYLYISYNQFLGLCGFRNVTYDLPYTSIKIFNASYLHCESGISLSLYCDDVSPFLHTSIKELNLTATMSHLDRLDYYNIFQQRLNTSA